MSLRNSHQIFLLKCFNRDKNQTDSEKTRTDGAASSPAWAGDSFQVNRKYWLLHVSPPGELVDWVYLLKHLQNTI